MYSSPTRAYSQVEGFITSFESIMSAALQRYAACEPVHSHHQQPPALSLHQVKLDLAHHFVTISRCLVAHTRLQHQLQRQASATNCLTLRGAYQDLSRLDFESIGQQLVVKYCARLNTVLEAGGGGRPGGDGHERRRRFLAMLPRMLHNSMMKIMFMTMSY